MQRIYPSDDERKYEIYEQENKRERERLERLERMKIFLVLLILLGIYISKAHKQIESTKGKKKKIQASYLLLFFKFFFIKVLF